MTAEKRLLLADVPLPQTPRLMQGIRNVKQHPVASDVYQKILVL